MPLLFGRKWQSGFCVIAVALTAAGGLRAQVAASGEPEEYADPAPSAPPTVDGEAESQSLTDNTTQCIEAHKQTQALQSAGQLVQAWEQASNCANLSCPGLLVADCARWLGDLDQRIPSVVFQVRTDGHRDARIEVFVDEKPVQNWTRGQALRLNPGQHTFRFELPAHPSVTEKLVVVEGMRFRVVSADFVKPTEHAPATRPEHASATRPMLMYPLLGVGALGLVSFVGFTLSGTAERSKLERTCSPRCTDSDMSTMRTRFLVGDISLGVGLAALVGAGIVYLVSPEQPTRSSLSFIPLAGGGIATLTMSRF